MRLTLLVPASSRHYKTLLIKENMQGVYRHLNQFTRASLPHLRTSSCNFDHKVHKVYKHLDSVLEGEEGQGSKVVVASSRKSPTPARTKGT